MLARPSIEVHFTSQGLSNFRGIARYNGASINFRAVGMRCCASKKLAEFLDRVLSLRRQFSLNFAGWIHKNVPNLKLEIQRVAE